MSLKTRLSLLIVVLVTLIVIALSALYLHSVASSRFGDLQERATTAALQVQSLLIQRISERTASQPPPADFEGTKSLWSRIVREDAELAGLLKDTMASSRTILEIGIAGADGDVLASSNPSSVGKALRALPSLAQWARLSPWEQLAGVFGQRQDYEVTIPLGVEGHDATIFRIQVVLSSVLLRNALMPQVNHLAKLVVLSLLAAILLAVAVSNLAFRPLARIGETIDRIARGEFMREPGPPGKEAKEYAEVQSKLSVLGQQYRGAKEDAVELRGNIEQLLDRLEGAVLLFDKGDRLIMAGRGAEGILDSGRWELMGRSLDDLFPGSTPLGAAVQGAVHFRRSLKDHPLTLDREGRPSTHLLVNVELLEGFPNRERLGTLVTLRDAESRRQLESQLDVSTRLAAIGRLTGGVAHEIKNPLNAMALHLEVLKAKLADQEPDLQREIQIIGAEIARLNRVVKTFLDFNRPVELKLREVDLAGIAREVANLVQVQARNNRVEVVADAQPGNFIRGDRDLIKQAVLNVVVNAVEAMPDGGEVSIRLERKAGECVLSVADRGPGIPPEIHEKIFNLYFTTKGKGSGIGLAMTFRVVQLHNGTIDFASEPGRGTTFLLRFPAIAPESVPAAEVGEEKSGG